MNIQRPKPHRLGSLAVAACILIGSASGLSLFGADNPTQAPDWPGEQKNKISAAIAAVLTNATRDSKLREKLLAGSDSAKEAVQAQVNDCYRNDKIELPIKLRILFYEPFFDLGDPCATHPATPVSEPETKSSESDGLALVFYLPAAKYKDHDHFTSTHIRCCYPVWHENIPPCTVSADKPSPTPGK